MFIISGLQQFGLHRNMQNKVDSWVHGHNPVFCDLPSKSLCQASWAANLSRQGELSFGRPRKWPISSEKWVVINYLRISKWAANYKK